jgi:heme-degrading monooxygenase HmoA
LLLVVAEKYHIAQANVAYARGSTQDPIMKGFHDRIDEMNSLADKSPGFVWRFVTDSRDRLDRVYEDSQILFTFSVWESIEALHHFAYKTAHAEVYAGRRQWFADWSSQAGASLISAPLVLWWIAAGRIPTVEEAKEKLRLISERGPTPLAFHFKTRFSPEEYEAFIASEPSR